MRVVPSGKQSEMEKPKKASYHYEVIYRMKIQANENTVEVRME